jgi:hypothetical protein
MSNRFLFGLALFSMLLAGCAKKPQLYTSDEVMEEFSPNYFKFKYLTARGRIVLEEGNGKTTKGTVYLRAKNDSAIWFSMTPGLGLEAVRGIITKDKVRIKDRMNGEDVNMSFEEIEDRFELKLSFELLQNLIFANVPNEFSYRDRLLRVGKFFELTQVRDGFRYHSRVGTSHGKVEEITSTALNDMAGFMANYPTFENIAEQPFPNKMLIRMSWKGEQGNQSTIIHLDLTRIESTDLPISFPFQF